MEGGARGSNQHDELEGQVGGGEAPAQHPSNDGPSRAGVASRARGRGAGKANPYAVRVRWADHKARRILQLCVECESKTAKLWCKR